MAENVTLEQQIACVRRELALRCRVYPRWVGAGRMTQAKSNDEIAAMLAVHQTLLKGHPEWDLIQKLREPEGATVTLICDDPDFNNQPNAKISVCDGWTGWKEREFTGETVLEALRAAKAAMDAAAAK